jgi:hypothetical protein
MREAFLKTAILKTWEVALPMSVSMNWRKSQVRWPVFTQMKSPPFFLTLCWCLFAARKVPKMITSVLLGPVAVAELETSCPVCPEVVRSCAEHLASQSWVCIRECRARASQLLDPVSWSK